MTLEPKWRALDQFRANLDDDWAVWRGSKRTIVGLEGVSDYCRKWHPLRTELIACPGEGSLLPPPFIPTLACAAQRGVIAAYKRAVYIWAALVIFWLGLYIYNRFDIRILPGISIGFALLITVYIELRTFRYLPALQERALFLHWLRMDHRVRFGLALSGSSIALIGCVQLLAVNSIGSINGLIIEWGGLFTDVRAGQYWRLITGPFIHSSPEHYFGNLANILVIGPIAYGLFGLRSLPVFLLGNIVGAAAQIAIGPQHHEALTGISAGILSLFAFVVVAGTALGLLPRGGGAPIAACGIVGVAVSELMTNNPATLAHLSGVAIGVAAAWALVLFERYKSI